MTAHDVRHLRVCEDCNHLGDGRRGMLKLDGKFYHDRCLIGRMTLGELMRLPPAERAKITIGAAGPDLMRKLMEGRNLMVHG